MNNKRYCHIFTHIVLCFSIFFVQCKKNETINREKLVLKNHIQNENRTQTVPNSVDKVVYLNSSSDYIAETSISFLGWKNDKAVLRQEDFTEEGELRTSFFSLIVGKGRQKYMYTRPDYDKAVDFPEDPPHLKEGSIIVYSYQPMVEYPKVFLKVKRDENNDYLLDKKILDWTIGKKIPEMVGLVQIQYQESSSSKIVTIWEGLRNIGPFLGDAGLESRSLSIRFAGLSPTKKNILVFIDDGNEIDYLILPLDHR